MPPSGIDPAAFPCLEADLDRVRDALGPVRIQGRPELDALTQEGPGTSRGLVRPTLALLSYYVLTDPSVPADDRAVLAAAAVEMLHLGALYHDDVVDHAHERRGRPSANAVWGDHLAILAGDCVMLTGLNMLAQLGQREVVEGTMANERMCAGMVMEAADLYAVSRSEQAYLDAIGGKTAHLFALACRLGAVQADRDGGRQESREEALAGFGWQFGYAYQLRDDILDLTSTVEELGKPVNTDLSEGVYTLPVIRAVSRDRDLGRLLGKEMTQEEAARARDLVVASGAVQEAQAVADAYMTEAADRLSHLTDHSCALDGLTAYARAVLDRPTASRPAVIPHQVRQAPQPQNSAHAEQVTRRLKGWLVETGIAATPAEADHHRLSGALSMIERIIPRVADEAGNADSNDDDLFERKQTSAALGMLFGMWDDLFEDPQLTDPRAVTALREGLVATLRQSPGAPWTHGAIPTSWAQLWPRLCKGRTVRWQEALLDNIEEWLHACEREARHRISGYIPSPADWLPLRRSTGGFEVGLACSEIVQDREMPPAVRSHRLVRRLEDLGFFVVFAENDLAGVDQDEADQVPYNLVRAIRHEMGCSRAEAIERVERQVAEKRAQFNAVYKYVPVLFRTLPGLSGQGDRYAAIYDMLKLFFDLRQGESERYQPKTTAVGPDLERLRREISRPAAPAPSTR
ncbi:polyprenyl synthetase family protein [Streptomyces sp. NBC_00201]|uniref:polyprenyl synthetase family protein n=1 Tax=unclassified Streptomyces TaxID=2593676 RepID=UPI0022516056|nr:MULTISPECIES: polyprenyl synthetase family protein [unclassified Streptomyces]MCX5064212.1 polyprenyl synthetase family protein [Streptomyces sp. NBC_00452]MCX5251994.1 polyprenyl synthetase family protein [Streptomyces sp. NBC_00201]